MPSWWGKSSSKDIKKKTTKENFIDTLHRFISSSEQKGTVKSSGNRRRTSDIISEKGSLSRAESRSTSPSTQVSRCQSFADRLIAQPLPLPSLQQGICRTTSGITISKPILEKRGKPLLHLPIPKPVHIPRRPEMADTDGDLATASVSSNCSIDSEEAADSTIRNGIDYDRGIRRVQWELQNPVSSVVDNQLLSVSSNRGAAGSQQTNIHGPYNGAFGSAPDSSMSSPSRSPIRGVFPEQIPTNAFWASKPYPDVTFTGSGQCSSPGSGQTSGHNSMGGEMLGQLFWQHSRAPESPTSRPEEGKKRSHRLPLPSINISVALHFLLLTYKCSLAFLYRSPGRSDNPHSPGSRWKKGRLIGRGTFGHVYVGFNSESGEMCAMKEVTLFLDDAKSKESAKQLGQEISLLRQLRHKNIVQYYGCEMVDDKLYIYLEYVSGGSIHKLLQEYGQFGEPAIRSYTKQILSGLAYLHAKKTVHRDIKGANILVDPNGQVKLADFGMAKHITGQSCPLSFRGSPYWMAPEVIKNVSGCNLAVDIWSLGCTVLEMATSKPPWSQYEGIAAMFKIGNSKELPTIPDHLSDEGKDFCGVHVRNVSSLDMDGRAIHQSRSSKNICSCQSPIGSLYRTQGPSPYKWKDVSSISQPTNFIWRFYSLTEVAVPLLPTTEAIILPFLTAYQSRASDNKSTSEHGVRSPVMSNSDPCTKFGFRLDGMFGLGAIDHWMGASPDEEDGQTDLCNNAAVRDCCPAADCTTHEQSSGFHLAKAWGREMEDTFGFPESGVQGARNILTPQMG
ncbi:hypothetical protein HPP92_008295 [Vanilla planifolia]|uniref:mitogen-activated protein kinase kinase kinase n=1 Tax=Vanilla planifolia TaxID=51239 RepID=A0A835R614_VANPL|nr:hypothetical protein HPP92_008295 [Vanilla planifolia]